MKIGIISELGMNNVNYGNRLQAIALNRFLSNNLDNDCVESIVLENSEFRKLTKLDFKLLVKTLFLPLKKYIKKNVRFDEVYRCRLESCNKFTEEKANIKRLNGWRDIVKEKYDVIIVGSDVVWNQVDGFVNRIKFLDIPVNENLKKIAYAASFGKNEIPKCNIDHVKKCLTNFCAISVREKTAISLLRDIGVSEVEHVCDPTLLITKEEWEALEVEPENINKNKYIFTYLLGKDTEIRKSIKEIAKKNNLIIVNVLDADGKLSNVDKDFGNINLKNCSPENWIWLIHNASYVFTDSFHGCVFSTIFKKKFVVVNREKGINIRMQDFLDTIGETDKFIENLNYDTFKEIQSVGWKYDDMSDKTNYYIEKSKLFLKNVLTSM